MSKRIASIAVLALVAGGLAVSAATASPKKHTAAASSHLLVGINDEADTLYGNPVTGFQALKALKAQVLRVNLYWGGTPWAVSRGARPTDATDPGDPAYDWSLYDRLVRYATTYDIKIIFSIVFTPAWANGGEARTSRADRIFNDLHDVRVRGRTAVQRLLHPAGLAAAAGSRAPDVAAAGGDDVDGVERAEQPGLPVAAVRKGRAASGSSRAPRTTPRSATRSIAASTLTSSPSDRRCPASRSRAASPRRRATTRRERPARPSIRSRSSRREEGRA